MISNLRKELKSVVSESEARHVLVNQLVEQSLAQQDQWNKEKADLIASWGVDPDSVHELGKLDVSDIALLKNGGENVQFPGKPPHEDRPSPQIETSGVVVGTSSSNPHSIEYLKSQVSYLEGELAASNKQCSVFLLEIEKCREQLEVANNRIKYYSNLQDTVASISEEAKSVKSRSEQAAHELCTVRTERDVLLSRLKDAEVEIQDASNEVVVSNAVHQSLWTRVKELEADTRSISREWDIKLEESMAATKVALEELSRSRSECDALNVTIASHEKEISQLTQLVREKTEEQGADNKRAYAEEILVAGDAIVKLQELKKEHAEKLTEIASLNSEVEALEEIKNYLEADNEAVHLVVVDKVFIFRVVGNYLDAKTTLSGHCTEKYGRAVWTVGDGKGNIRR